MATVAPTPRTNRITLITPSVGPFLVGFRLFDSENLRVSDGDGPRTDWTLSADFSEGFDDDARITFGRPASGIITIEGDMVPDREGDYRAGDPTLTQKLNIELARHVAIMQEQRRDLKRAPLLTGPGQDPLDPIPGYYPRVTNDGLWELSPGIGAQGPRGPKGDPGNYLGLNLIGASDDIADRPATASNGQAWGLIGDSTITIFVWSSGQWSDVGPLTSPEAFPVAGAIYVQGNGNNSNSGTSLSTAVRTIERALQIAATRNGAPTLIEVYPGNYTTQGNLDVPDNVAIVCKHRTAFIRPAAGFEERNVFRLGSGCFLEGLTMDEGWRVDSLENPTVGFLASFRPGAVINRVPYIHKCAVRTTPSWGLVPPPLNPSAGNPLVGRGAGVILADGMVCSQYSRFRNIMAWGATPVSPNGIGYCAKNGGLINAVNAVSMWAHKHFLALSGGQIILSACSTQFGDWSLYADGVRNVVRAPAVAGTLSLQVAASNAIAAGEAAIINAMWSGLVSGGFTTGWTALDETYTRADAAQFIRALRWTLEAATDKPVRDFVAGLFDAIGNPVFDAPKTAAFVASFVIMRDQINGLPIADEAKTIVTNAVAMINAVLNNHTAYHIQDRSRITAIGHTWTANRSGVALPPQELPSPQTVRPIRESIRQVDGGVVIASGQDDSGNALFVGGLEIDARSGRLQGPPFEQAVRQIALQTAVLGSF